MFKNHLAMIGMNETPNKKAKFWQSYIRSLKGSDDIRAHEGTDYRRPFTIFDEPESAASRITVPGYRYLPVHRETYGYSPRNIYSQSRPVIRESKTPINAQTAWEDHNSRMRELEKRYPSRFGLYLKDKPNSQNLLPQDVEYEPESKPYRK